MQTLALISQKGGAGKTTLAVHLAAEAHSRGLKTLLIDVDQQASAANWGDRRGDALPLVVADVPVRINKSIERARTDGYDFIVIDTPPHADQSGLYAARAADLIAIPCRATVMDLDAIEATIELGRIAKKRSEVILNAVPATATQMMQDAAQGIGKRGGTLCRAVIRDRAAFRHAINHGMVAQEYELDCRAAQEIAVLFDCLFADMTTCGQEAA